MNHEQVRLWSVETLTVIMGGGSVVYGNVVKLVVFRILLFLEVFAWMLGELWLSLVLFA